MAKKSESVSRETGDEFQEGRPRRRNEFLDDKGREIMDPIPMAPPIGYQKQPSMMERVRDMVRSEHVRLAALQAGAETFEEADDFEVGDDYDVSSPYEEVFDPVDNDARMRLRQEEYAASVEARFQDMKPLQQKEKEDGSAKGSAEDRSDKGRLDDVGGGNGKPVARSKGKSEPKSDADDA